MQGREHAVALLAIFAGVIYGAWGFFTLLGRIWESIQYGIYRIAPWHREARRKDRVVEKLIKRLQREGRRHMVRKHPGRTDVYWD
jgi:hypothetical protein